MMIAIVNMFFVTLSLLLTMNAASIHAHMLEPNDYQLDHPILLSRKLLIDNKVDGYEAKKLVSPNEQNEVSTGEFHKKRRHEVEVMVHAAKGTRQEWIEGSDSSHEFFTMDYTNVKRRRPIHNKSFPKTVTNSP